MTKEDLQKYFYNLCTQEEANRVEGWLSNLKDGTDSDALLKEILDGISIKEDADLINRAYAKFENAIQSNKAQQPKEETLIHKIGRYYRWAAAVLLLPLIISTLYFNYQRNNPKEWVEEYVPYGKNKVVSLPDHSKIHLNAGTKLIYPRKFNNSIRQIYVAGEAYVEVTKDKTRPFILSAGEVSVEVLGTKFNVKSYSEDSEISVSLMEGSVKMNAHFKGTLKTELLKPGEIVKFSKETGALKKSEFIVATRDKWYNGKGFYFIDESLAEITKELERYFDVRINIENEDLKHQRFYSIFINNESLKEILTALNANGQMRIRENSDMIYIY